MTIIDGLDKLVRNHFGAGEFRFTKFCQRLVGPETKVLFLVTRNGSPLTVLKLMRRQTLNEKLKREKEVQTKISPHGRCRAPRVYFDAEVEGYYVYAEEAIEAMPITPRRARAAERELVTFACSFPAGGIISAQEIATAIEHLMPREEANALAFIGRLRESDVTLRRGLTHGDFGTPNILARGSDLFVVDWGRAGEQPFYGMDAVYLMIRLRKIKDLADWQTRAAADFKRYTGIEIHSATTLYCVHTLFEVLRKKYPKNYENLRFDLAVR